MDDILRQVAQIFVAESTEQMDRIAQALMTLEHRWDGDLAETVFRDAHSLKGASSSLGLTDLEQLAHHMEEALVGLRVNKSLTPALLDACLAAVNAAKLRFDGVLADTDIGKEAVGQAIGGLSHFMGQVEQAAAPEEVRGQVHVEPDGFVMVLPEDAAPKVLKEPEHIAETVTHRDPADEQMIRVSTKRVGGLEHCLADMRLLQGHLERRLRDATKSGQQLEEQVHRLRFRRQGALQEASDLPALLDLQRGLSALRRGLRDDVDWLQQSINTFSEDLDAIRMVDVGSLSAVLAQAVREAARRTGREALLVFDGGGVLVDRRLLDEMKHPLLHLVRNAVAHGIETPAQRVERGKNRVGKVRVQFQSVGSQVRVLVEDDGRGIDTGAVQKRAIDVGLIGAAQARELTPLQTYELLFRPGFSTETRVNEISGRGVGLDVVRDTVTRMRGQVRVHSALGEGSTFVLQLPLSIASCEALLLREGEQTVALPLSEVSGVVRVPFTSLHTLGGKMFYDAHDGPLPLAELGGLLGMPLHGPMRWNALIVVLHSNGRSAGLLCEEALAISPIVLRPLPEELQNIDVLNGVSVSPSGTPFFVLASHVLLEAVHATRGSSGTGDIARTILVADDSLTTRSLLRSTLEANGFVVFTAADGDEALRIAESNMLNLVVSDIRMPRVDGIALTQMLRARPETANIPVVLFSALDSPEDRQRGPAAGADAYINKSEFDRGALIDVVNQLLERSR